MTDFDDDSGVYSSAVNRRTRRRKQAVVGVAGLAAILGGGAFFVTEAMTAQDRIAPEPAALAPISPRTSPSTDSPYERRRSRPTPSTSTTATKSAVAGEKSPTPEPSNSPSLTAEQQVAAARAAAAQAGYPVQRPLPQTGTAAGEGDVSVTNSGSLAKGGTLRVVSAPYDLTGQREQAWAADDGDKVGDVRCTQKFRFSNDSEARERPTMLLCWRTSDSRSVVTVAVAKQGRPARAASIAAIERQWDRLG